MKEKHYKRQSKKRILYLTIALCVIVVLIVSSVFGDWLQIINNDKTVTELNIKYNNLLSQEEQLQSDVNKLKDSNYVARYAREKYLYTKEGELIIRIPKSEN